MSKARLSVGTDTPTGEPAGGPTGPYITDEHDDELAAALRRPSAQGPAKNRRTQSQDGSQAVDRLKRTRRR